jgi:hypothetical protein
MSLIITGSQFNSTSPLQATVTALANNGAGAIRVTTSAPHLFGNGDMVEVFTSAPGLWAVGFVVAVVDATHFDLVGSTFATTATGFAKDLSLTPQVLVPTDGDSFSLQLSGMLSSQQAILDRTQYLASLIRAGVASTSALDCPARNWHLPSTLAGIDGPYQIVWNDAIVGTAAQQWMLTAFTASGSPTWRVEYTDGTGDGPTATTAVSSQFPVAGLAVNPATGDLWATSWTTAGGGGLSTWFCVGGNLAAWTVEAVTAAAPGVDDAKIVYQNGHPIVAVGSTTAGSAAILEASGTGFITHVSGLSVTSWALRSNGSLCVALPTQTAGATPSIYTSADGVTWTTTSLAAVLATTETPQDLAYSTALGVWLMVVGVTAGSFRTMVSADAQHWTSIGVTHTSGLVSSVAASGAYWVGTIAPAGGTTWRVVFSPDGITWYRANTAIVPGITNYPATLAVSATALALYSPITGNGATALPYRFSHEGDLPSRTVA